jgi:hypothetical protein
MLLLFRQLFPQFASFLQIGYPCVNLRKPKTCLLPCSEGFADFPDLHIDKVASGECMVMNENS